MSMSQYNVNLNSYGIFGHRQENTEIDKSTIFFAYTIVNIKLYSKCKLFSNDDAKQI